LSKKRREKKTRYEEKANLPLSLGTPVTVRRDLEVAKGIGLLTELLGLRVEFGEDGH